MYVPTPHRFVAGKVQECHSKWTEITSDKTVLERVKYSVPPPFTSEPEPFCLPNPSLGQKQSLFIDSEIEDLLQSGAIVECDYRPKSAYFTNALRTQEEQEFPPRCWPEEI